MEVLQTIEQLGAVRLLKASYIAYPVVNALHIASIGALLTCVILLDLRILGAFRSLPRAAFVDLFRRLALAAFLAAALTGLMLFSVRASDYAAMPVFLLKLSLIAAAMINFLVFSALHREGDDGTSAGPALRVPIIASLLLWPAILLCGRFIGFL